MNGDDISEMIQASLMGIKDFARADVAIGGPILTPSGSTIIPISKVSIGFAGGGAWASKTHSRRCLRWGTFRYSRGRLRPPWSELTWCHGLY